MTFPDCMMPNGAEPCKGYQELHERIAELERELNHYRTNGPEQRYWEGRWRDEHARNADLRARLAELIEAARCIADHLERVGDTRMHKDGQFIADVRAAIAKAEGQQADEARG